jgi:hypothetical protein
MPTTEQVLDEIRKVVSFEAAYVSREKARKFYDSHELPAKLSSYVKNRSQSISRTAKTLGLAADTLKRIMSGDSITENMLFRPRNSLEQLKAANQPSSASKSRRKTFSGDWRNTNSIDIQAAISEVANRLRISSYVATASRLRTRPSTASNWLS